MPVINFMIEKKSIEVAAGTTILQGARAAGVVIESPCNGAGTCGKCKVWLGPGEAHPVAAGGSHRLSGEEAAKGYVLSCETAVFGDISVHTLQHAQNRTLKIVSEGKSFHFNIAPHITKEYREAEDRTYVLGGGEVLGTEKGNTRAERYGLVVDIGTTTLVASLADLNDGKELASASALNPQAIYAQDVLSRIKFASEEEGLTLLYTDLAREINRMIGVVAEEAGIAPGNIYETVFSGNTCMLHLAAKVNPYSLGQYPYRPEISGADYLKASDHELDISSFGVIYLPPIVSAYVGADITSGILAAQLYEEKGTALFVDIGTNGEMVLSLDGTLSATSTAAGPAFEGMNISHGMRAGKGAIELFNVEADGSLTVKTIGDAEAVGICGSGLLDIVGELAAYGVLKKNGKYAEPGSKDLLPSLRERLVYRDGKPAFQVTDTVFLSQKDVRQVQLAKGAVRAGIEFLLESKGITAAQVDRVLIAGSFGYHLRAKSLIHLGLLPQEFEGKIDFIGNTSKTGGQAFLLNHTFKQKMERVVKDIEVIELANYKNFDRVFVQCLNF